MITLLMLMLALMLGNIGCPRASAASRPALETVDDTYIASFSAVTQAMLDPPATSGPAVAAILLEDPPGSWAIHFHCLGKNIVCLLHGGGSDERLPQLRSPAVVGTAGYWLILWQRLIKALALDVVEQLLTFTAGSGDGGA